MPTLGPSFDEIPDPSSAHFQERVRSWLAGTYCAAWDRLKEAACSGTIAATHGASQAYETWKRICERRAAPAEIDFLTDLNHTVAVHGPALGVVVTTAFAIESFIRLGYVVALERRRPKAVRATGIDVLTRQRLKDFDARTSKGRMVALRRAAQLAIATEVEAAALELVRYRNELAHDSPVLHLASGEAQPVFEKRKTSGPYEPLVDSHRPVRLRHVIAAIRAHDCFVAAAVGSAELPEWADAISELGGPLLKISDYVSGSTWWRDTRDLSRAWEAGPEHRGASAAQWYDFRANLSRRTRLKLED